MDDQIIDDQVIEEKCTKGEWFVIHTLSGRENRVRDTIERESGLKDDDFPVYEAFIATEKISEVKQGKKRTITRKLFPGYIWVRMDLYDVETRKLNEDAWYFIRNIQGIIGFVGSNDKPVPLSEQEVADVMNIADGEDVATRPKIEYEIGEVVRIRDGAFENFEGNVEEIDQERGKLKLMVSIFGRSTPVELEFWQVERES
jgi:transcription termination/antitermination protein NusG